MQQTKSTSQPRLSDLRTRRDQWQGECAKLERRAKKMPRLVRRRPLMERLKAYLNPLDFALWVSEEIETRDWDTKSAGTYLGLWLNFLFLIARSNRKTVDTGADDVFGDDTSGTGWFGWFASFLVMFLAVISLGNAAYTFLRKRHYRLFENSVEIAPSTPSAHRVRVDSSPVSSSPLRFLSKIISDNSADSRSHPDPTRDVWEVAVWDPLPACLQLFCIFSPGHVLVYWLFLPIAPSDPRPSVTVVTTIVLELLLSAQMLLFQATFSQQSKDASIIHKEVMNEYDVKFVHPLVNGPPVRDVGTQFNSSVPTRDIEIDNEVETGVPLTILRRTFKTNPNPNYAKYIAPENEDLVPKREITVASPLPAFRTPGTTYSRRESTPLRISQTAIRQPNFRPTTGVSTGTNTRPSTGINDGGSLGIFSHVNSPLKKSTSMYDMPGTRTSNVGNSLQAAAREIAEGKERDRKRSMSPTKRLHEEQLRRTTMPAGFNADTRPSKGYY